MSLWVSYPRQNDHENKYATEVAFAAIRSLASARRDGRALWSIGIGRREWLGATERFDTCRDQCGTYSHDERPDQRHHDWRFDDYDGDHADWRRRYCNNYNGHAFGHIRS
jgi:hypothetical protein